MKEICPNHNSLWLGHENIFYCTSNIFMLKLLCIILAFSFLGATSLVHLTVEGLVTAVQLNIPRESVREIGHCTACLTGNYPVELEW